MEYPVDHSGFSRSWRLPFSLNPKPTPLIFVTATLQLEENGWAQNPPYDHAKEMEKQEESMLQKEEVTFNLYQATLCFMHYHSPIPP